jgi:hypothetical protein
MTDYTDFIRDFPARCGDVLKLAYCPARAQDREVTLLIMTAAAALLVPFERLRPGMAVEHLGADRRTYPDLANQLDAALKQPFLKSPFRRGGPGSWSVGKIDHPEASVSREPLTMQTPASQVLATIRNALAHGNLFTIGGADASIEVLRFFSEDRRDGKLAGYRYLHVSPADFHSFLCRWFLFLKAKSIPPIVVAEALDQTAWS